MQGDDMSCGMPLPSREYNSRAVGTHEACAHRELEAVVGVSGHRQRLLRQATRLQELGHIVQLVLHFMTLSRVSRMAALFEVAGASTA